MTLLPAQLAPLRRSRWRVTLVAVLAVLTTGWLITGASTSASARGSAGRSCSPETCW